MKIRPVTPADADTWLKLRYALWPEGSLEEHRAEIAQYFEGTFPRGPWEALLAEDEDGGGMGLIELSTRPYAEGCTTTCVAYVEGWFVAADARRQGVGRALIEAAERWGRERGCTELASDTDVTNTIGLDAHRAVGFDEVGVVRCLRKDL